jgi:hypothetical protein
MMTEEEQKAAIKALRAHHRDGTGAAWSLDPARPVAVHGECYEYEFVNPNGAIGFILPTNGIPRRVTDAASLARVLSVARGWDTVHAERRSVAAVAAIKRKVR